MWTAFLLLAVQQAVGLPIDRKSPIPEQIHLALGDQAGEWRVHWVTMQPVAEGGAEVQFGTQRNALNRRAPARTVVFECDGVTRFMHTAEMRDLPPSTPHYYRVGSPSAFSDVFEFRTFPPGSDFPLRVCVFGDLGVDNGVSLVHLQRAAERGEFDLVIHVGDLAYDLHKENGTIGDIFMNSIQPIATREYKNFTHYRHRFPSPPNDAFGDSQSYSFNLGPVHFVGISTEYYGFFYEYGKHTVKRQDEWLRAGLEVNLCKRKVNAFLFQRANFNRNERPFIIAYMHRPFYCSNTNSFECDSFENTLVRTGFEDMPGLEEHFVRYGVDIGFQGHEHSYERFYPIAERRIYNLSSDPYHNPPAPTHTPHAGFNEETPTPGSASRSTDYGYTLMHVLNRTTIYVEQISIEQNLKPIDSFWLIKDAPHPAAPSKRSIQHPFVPFPPMVESQECRLEDPRCRVKRDRGLSQIDLSNDSSGE
ncbi:Purple acid phosphatase [Aphelenchoides fujianensis]|nr:Purple acid phosphatase [Aphelenchoides fujianensis]